MKWLGFVSAAVVLVMLLVVRNQGRRSLTAEKKAVDEQVAACKTEVEALVQRAADGLPALRERLEAETRKAADLERQLAELEQKKAGIDQALKSLSGSADKLRQDRDDATGKRDEDKQQIRDLQDKITDTETQVSRLRKALARVTEKATP
jgi:chromosome segregation ATPase